MRTQSVDLLASARATGGSLTVVRLAVDGGPPRHVHEHEDESLYLFTGELEVECGDETFTAAPGCFVFMPRRVPHAFRSIGGPVTGLLIATPGGIDEYFAPCTPRPARTPTRQRWSRSWARTASREPDG
jgi:quercetin dioxygenase-like cupin family protein